jgi:hypothetical protein
MDIHDKLEVLAANASICAAIMLHQVTGAFALVDLDAPDLPKLKEELIARGMALGGCVGLIEGKPQVTLTTPLEANVSHTVTVLFLSLVKNKINARLAAQAAGDSADWIKRLYSLPDTREN